MRDGGKLESAASSPRQNPTPIARVEMSKTRDDATRDLLSALPYFRKAVADVRAKGGKVQLGVLSTNADGSGKIEMRFDADEFFDDLALILNAPPQTEKDDMAARALKFFQTHRLSITPPKSEV